MTSIFLLARFPAITLLSKNRYYKVFPHLAFPFAACSTVILLEQELNTATIKTTNNMYFML